MVTGGILPYIWSIVSGSIPPGLNFDDANAIIAGIPDTEGTFCCTFEIEDGEGATDSREFCISISEFIGLRGDVNGDAIVNILDVLYVINHILGTTIIAGDALIWADCNADSEINILDALGIVNVVLGINECEP